MSKTLKRLRVQLKALDASGLAETFTEQLSSSSVFLKTSQSLPPQTAVRVELAFADGNLALSGTGAVDSFQKAEGNQPSGMFIQLTWDEECLALLNEILDIQNAGVSEADSDESESEEESGLSSAVSDESMVLENNLAGAQLAPIELSKPGAEFGNEEPLQRLASNPDSVLSTFTSGEHNTAQATTGTVDSGRRAGDIWDLPERDSEMPDVELPPKSDLCIGIDLGTTNSCAALVEGGKARVIPSRRGGMVIPSVIALDAEGQILVGDPALRQKATNPTQTIVGSKRILGRDVHSTVVEDVKAASSYEVVEGPNGEAAVRLGDQVLSVEIVAAHILKEIRESVSLQLKKEINRAVITCPAYFQERQRQAVRSAGEQAGFHVERILAEPTSAALNYGFGRSLERRKILIYDLGGGTFDCSLMEVDADVYDVMATGGDSFLGGLDFDDRLARLLIKDIKAKYDIDPREDETALDRIMQAAERAKRDLSDHNSTVIRLDYFVVQDSNPQTIELTVERVIAERYWDSLVERTLAVVEDVCSRGQLSPSEVDDVILVGGQSRSPIVRRKVRELFGKEPRREVHPDEAVALGAAQYGNSLGNLDSLVLIDALPMSIGVGLPGGRFKKVIERDTKLPVSRSYTIRTTHDDQTSLKVVVFQGEEDRVTENDLVGTLKVLEVPENVKGAESVEVTFEMTGEGLLNLRAKILSSGREVETKLYTKATPSEVREALSIPAPNPRDAVGGTGAVVVPDRPKSKGVGGWIKNLFGS